jgi:hypothetical protein
MATLLELRRALRAVAFRFVDEVIAVAKAHASAFVAPSAALEKVPVRRVRRNVRALEDIAEEVAGIVAGAKRGASVSEIARAVGRTPSEIARPMTLLVAAGRITKRGERRGTRYFPPVAAPAKTAAPARRTGRTRGPKKRRRA